MRKASTTGLLLLGALLMVSSCSHDSVTPDPNADGLKRQKLPIENRLTPEYLGDLWDSETDDSRLYVSMSKVMNLVAGDEMTEIPETYPQVDMYQCSITIPPGSVQGGSPSSALITIQVPEFEFNPTRHHPAFFWIFSNKELHFTNPVTVTICNFPWVPGDGDPTVDEFIYRIARSMSGEFSYSDLRVVTGDPQTGAITFQTDFIPYRGPSLPDRSGTWTNETDEEADD